MKKKPKFNPEITRIKLNPEQAVLVCSCYDLGRVDSEAGSASADRAVCSYRFFKTQTSACDLFPSVPAS